MKNHVNNYESDSKRTMTMLNFLIPGLTLLLALIGSVALARPLRSGTDDGPVNFHAKNHDRWTQVP